MMNTKSYKKKYSQLLKNVMDILYEMDPDGIGKSIDSPRDEYLYLSEKLVSWLFRSTNKPDAVQGIRKFFPDADDVLIDALWNVCQNIFG